MHGPAVSSPTPARPKLPASAARSAVRVAGALVLAALMAVGCLLLWAGIPVGWLWLGAAISHDKTTIFVIALLGAPVTMVAWGFALGRVNDLYLLLRGAQRPVLIQGLLVGSVLLAIVAFLVWYFAFSGTPSATPWPDEFSGPGT